MNDSPPPPYYDKRFHHYRDILKKFIIDEIKQKQEKPKISLCLSFISELGYEVNRDDLSLLSQWLNSILNLDFIREVRESLQCSQVEEIIVHSPQWMQFFAKKRQEFHGKYLDNQDYQFSLELFCLHNKILWNESRPFQSFQVFLWGETWRATLIHSHICSHAPSKLFLRSQRKESFKIKDFHVSPEQEDFLKEIIFQQRNIIVCGATGSGKTTFLRSLLLTIKKKEHIALLEDTHEIILNSPFITKLLAGEKDGETLKDYCQYALRLRPDRIVLGEIRSAEVVPFLLSINTGHGGMMASLHANSAIDAIHRLCLLFQVYGGEMGIKYSEVLKLVCQGVDYIIYLNRKKVTEIVEIRGCEGTTPFYQTWSESPFLEKKEYL